MVVRKILGDLLARYLGVGGATPDATNVLSVRGAGTLLDGNAGGHQLRVNKAVAGNTASVAFQVGGSARAEIGLIAADDLEIRVSANGSTYASAMVVDRTTGRASFPSGIKQITVGTTAPSSPSVGDIWVDTN